MFKIQTLNNISKNGLSRLPAHAYKFGNDVADPDAVLVRSADMHGASPATSIKAVGRAGAGTNNIPVAEFSKRGVPVFNAPGANANAVKELVVAGMLISARNLNDALSFVGTLTDKEDLHHKVEAEKKRFVGSELSGKTLGVVGLCAIGVKVANAGSLNELFAASDYVTFHVPLNDATRGIFGAPALDAVKPGVVLLNFARE